LNAKFLGFLLEHRGNFTWFKREFGKI